MVYLRDQYRIQSRFNFFDNDLADGEGRNIPAASQQMTKKWEEWLRCQRVGLPSRGI